MDTAKSDSPDSSNEASASNRTGAGEKNMGASKVSLVGNLLDGRYIIEKELGLGGIGAVYIARDLKVLGRIVVVKVLLQEFFENDYVVKKFRQEAEALSRIDHPNIVGILDTGELPNGQPYLVLKFIDGVSLRSVMKPEGIELERSAHIMRQAAQALTAAHEKGILHRDLKPENIMLHTLSDGEEQVIIIDFGIARIKDSVVAPKTMIMATAGTMAYMSPEQLSAGEITPASDIYSLGIVAYELTTGRKPFNPASPFQLLEMQRVGVTVMPRELRPNLPEGAQAVILKTLAFDPNERYQSAREFGRAFYQAITGAPASHTSQVNLTNAPANLAVSPAATSPLNVKGTHAASTVQTSMEAAPVAQLITPTPAPEPVATKGSPKLLLILGVALLILAIAGGLVFAIWKFKRPFVESATTKQDQTQTAPGTSQTTAERAAPPGSTTTESTLTYSLTVQRIREGKEYKGPFQSSGQEIFENGWQFRLNISSPKSGYLYLLNEGLDEKGQTALTVLFPIGDSAQLIANQTVQIPSAPKYYYFTGESGTEKIWMVWSAQPVAELEAVKGLVNPKDQGEISDPAQLSAVRGLLTKYASSKSDVLRDTVNKQTNIKAEGNLIVHLAELEHQ